MTRLSYLQQQVVNGTIKFKEIHTKDQMADIMTKPLSPEAFGNLSRTLVHKLSSLYPENQSKGTTQHWRSQSKSNCNVPSYSWGGELELIVTRCIVQCKDSPVYHHTAWVGSWRIRHLTYVFTEWLYLWACLPVTVSWNPMILWIRLWPGGCPN